jgi:hypothetical protein
MRCLHDLGLRLPLVPDSVNLFQNSLPDHAQRIPVIDAVSRPGDHVTFEAELDLALIVTSCSVDIPPGNGERCTPILLEVSKPRVHD